ncbi:hypothetical protein DFH11DRAFT_1584613 [Phellopilus nigrolimitatus]|nr:hypothetical protein DFH11DRAFT_1584613 [Phellopilus nigrolimitatus]
METRPEHPVFLTPELRVNIFGLADRETQSRCARVCSLWSNDALNELWKDLESPIPLLSILAPLTDDYERAFTRSITPKDWRRFYQYSERVRYLTVETDTVSKLSSSLLLTISRDRRTPSLTPRLIELYLSSHNDSNALQLSAIFMDESLKRLIVRLPNDEPFNLNFFQEIVYRTPKLETLGIHMLFSMGTFGESLSTLIRDLNSLRKLTIPLFSFTSTIAEAAATLPQLNTIEFEHRRSCSSGNLKDMDEFSPVLPNGAFHLLTSLSVGIGLKELNNFISTGAMPNLTRLGIYSRELETSRAVFDFIVCASRFVLQLKSFTLDLIPEHAADMVEAEDALGLTNGEGVELDIVTLATLLPIRDLKHLTVFYFSYHRPLRLTNADVSTLLKDWTKLEKLSLNNEPIIFEKPMLSLDILPHIISICPKLVYLDFYVDCVDLPPRRLVDFIDVLPGRLEKFNLGVSPKGDMLYPLALYLSKILGPKCLVYANTSWFRYIDDVMSSKRGASFNNRIWNNEKQEEFNKIMTVLRAELNEERKAAEGLVKRVQELEKEVEDLTSTMRLLRKRIGVTELRDYPFRSMVDIRIIFSTLSSVLLFQITFLGRNIKRFTCLALKFLILVVLRLACIFRSP